MKPLRKFAIFITLAGVLAVLFAMFPDRRHALLPVPVAPPENPGTATLPESPSGGEAKPLPAEPGPTGAAAAGRWDPRVKIAAVRGLSRYGWVQLPYGTRVELVDERPATLLVRWDGTLAHLPREAEKSGAIVVVRKPGAASRKG